jgi:hypothetical protein
MHRAEVAGLLTALALAAGCGSRSAEPAPVIGPAGQPRATPAPTVIGVVDMGTVLRAHRRWPELAALLKKMQDVQFRLTNPPPPPALPPQDLQPELQAEADRLSAAYRAELAALEEQAKRRIDAYAADVKADAEAKVADRQRQANEELQRIIEARRDELQRELEKTELAIMAEYRIPLLNLRLKADVVGLSNEEEAKRLNEEASRLVTERDGKIKTKAAALDKTLQEFQQARTAEADAQFKALIASVEEDAAKQIEAKEKEARAELQAAVQEREARLRSGVEQRRQILAGGTEEQIRAAQERYAKQLQAEGSRLQAELQALQEQHLRLEDAMVAEINIEIAALAQQRKVDVVLTRVVASGAAVDLTTDVVARLRRQ